LATFKNNKRKIALLSYLSLYKLKNQTSAPLRKPWVYFNDQNALVFKEASPALNTLMPLSPLYQFPCLLGN